MKIYPKNLNSKKGHGEKCMEAQIDKQNHAINNAYILIYSSLIILRSMARRLILKQTQNTPYLCCCCHSVNTLKSHKLFVLNPLYILPVLYEKTHFIAILCHNVVYGRTQAITMKLKWNHFIKCVRQLCCVNGAGEIVYLVKR